MMLLGDRLNIDVTRKHTYVKSVKRPSQQQTLMLKYVQASAECVSADRNMASSDIQSEIF